MRPDDRRAHRDHRDGQGGIPDGLLIGILAFLLGMTLLVWTATGLAALFAHGSWPSGVTFTHTPLAMRSLITQPHDIPGAWPETPSEQLSGYGLFWGLFIGQLMVLIVLTVFVLGTVARWRAVRAGRRGGKAEVAGEPGNAEAPGPMAHDVPAPHVIPAPRTELAPLPAPQPPAQAQPQPQPTGHSDAGRPTALTAPRGLGEPAWDRLVIATRESRQATATQAVHDAEGPALVVTSNPALWQDTKDARAKLGPVLLYDPAHRCDTPARIHWTPTTGCEDKQTAVSRATALLTPVRPTSRLDQAVSDTAETLLRSYLHAAAIDGRTIRHVHRWSQGGQIQDAVRILRTNPKAAPGAAGELEAALTAHPERRDMAQELTTRALSALSTVNIRESCTPNRTDALTLDSFVHEGGTLYVVGESIEDPRTNPGAMPLLTALAASVVERGRRMAERSSSGRLDPPLTLVLDDVAAVAPLPQLPELLATGADRGMPTLALLRSREQARSRWPHDELPV
ncbi:type IV secretory system conjugative DNA transfer family protein [Streptomyces viridochromogenes]|uniref:type IV secretory system conjugative DNA transfer family protein n=1 Tax=Streptomyces viridochromogenes TaxID=1938 RepID=UPI00069E1E6B|nr:type IV secretory system conjugative DNA transfer family protein [Streptomyces viridochromogenes]KOG09946.1 type VI secretion protein [Streptomyces viridochromogenes]KOG21392.1 type VI secretion protein [Streptomyces viridochromogenes]